MILYVKKRMLEEYVDGLIEGALVNSDDKRQQVQSVIHPELAFRYNSINLLVGRRGAGKTFRVLKEIIKLSQLPDCAGYTSFLYVSDKTNDSTVNELIKLIKLKTRIVGYDDVQEVLEDIIDAKSAYQDVLEKSLQDEVDKGTKQDLFTTLDLKKWSEATPHTIVLLDDAINVLQAARFRKVQNLLFQNRQPRLTIFICVQDIFGIPIKIRRNCDSVWIYAGMTDKMAFGIMSRQLGIDNVQKVWEVYHSLNFRDVMVVNYGINGVEINVLN
jgi:hypothetical protein